MAEPGIWFREGQLVKAEEIASSRLVSSLRRVAIMVFTVAVPLILITTTVRVFFHSDILYRRAVDDYSLAEATGFTREELHLTASALHEYLDGARPSPDVSVGAEGTSFRVFNDTEVAHLVDVKQRLDWLRLANLALVAYVVIFLVAARISGIVSAPDLARSLVRGALFVLALGALAGGLSIVVFSSAWAGFHEVLFSGGWQFDLRNDRLIQIFPPDFWQDAVLWLGVIIEVEALLLGAGAAAWMRYQRQRKPVSKPAAEGE